MTTQSGKSNISKALWSNSKINAVEFQKKKFAPTNKGHGLFVKTKGGDTLIDLRLSREKPFWGHTHPLITQHSHHKLNYELLTDYYSVSKNEFSKITETFQRVSLTQVLSPSFKVTCHNVVITIDELMLLSLGNNILKVLSTFINSLPQTFFWFIEKDLILLNSNTLFHFQSLMNKNQVHLCIDLHFIDSIFIYSYHLFSKDKNIQLFLGMKNLYEFIISNKGSSKNTSDHRLIDHIFSKEYKSHLVSRKGRYIIIHSHVPIDSFHKNGILISKACTPEQTILAIPTACTKAEMGDMLERIKLSL